MLLLLFLLLLVVVALEGDRVVLGVLAEGWSRRGWLVGGACLHSGSGSGLESGWWWPDWRRLVHLLEDLGWGWRRWRGVLDGDVVRRVVDDNLVGGRGGLTSRGAPEQLVCLSVEFWGPWGRSPDVALNDGLIEDVGGVGGSGGSRLRLDHRVGGVDGGLEDGDGAVLLAKVLSGWGRGQADHLLFLFCLDPDLLELQLAFADVFVVIFFLLVLAFFLVALVWGEAWTGLGLAGPDSPPLFGLPGVKPDHVPGLPCHDGLARRGSHFPPLLLLLLAGQPLASLPFGPRSGLG